MSRRPDNQRRTTPVLFVIGGLAAGLVAGLLLLDRVVTREQPSAPAAPTYSFLEGTVEMPDETFVLSKDDAARRAAELAGCTQAYIATLPAMTEAQKANDTTFQAEAVRRMQDAYRACGVIVREAGP